MPEHRLEETCRATTMPLGSIQLVLQDLDYRLTTFDSLLMS